MDRFEIQRGAVRLSVLGFGGSGPPVLMLHGLAGYAGEWEPSAQLLLSHHRVFALDQRGHGDSERHPGEVTRAALVADCAAAIGHIDDGPVVLVGQSMGARTAMLTAAAHPDLVRGLVIIEGSPAGPEPPVTRSAVFAHFTELLSAWPVPFVDASAAEHFFASRGFDPAQWTAGLERRVDGLWPRWDVATLAETMAELVGESAWEKWRQIRCPTLVVLGEHGLFGSNHGAELVRELPGAAMVVIQGAGHDVHLDAPRQWVEALAHSAIISGS
jgi:pimeloyl-ACP methyl ester carboxylesterase